MKDFMTLYSGLVERCFMDCANDFTTTKLKAGEESCVNHCADKFLALSTRCVWFQRGLRARSADRMLVHQGRIKILRIQRRADAKGDAMKECASIVLYLQPQLFDVMYKEYAFDRKHDIFARN